MITEEDVDDPLQRLFLGPEKLLSLYSESNWGNYCLSYLLTNRDYSGVLGLAWEGKAGESCSLDLHVIQLLCHLQYRGYASPV